MGFLNNYSPLRYPGGKAAIADFFASVLSANEIGQNGVYCEPYAGGAGVALTLLLTDKVERIIINDYDECIAAFWRSMLRETQRFVDAIRDCDVSMETWKKQREIYDRRAGYDEFTLGFATFFLNRCNRAGILPKAGPIGGVKQNGRYTIAARFKKEVLIARIEQIAKVSERIKFENLDAISFLKRLQKFSASSRLFVYLDPPYYVRGKELYFNYYHKENHLELSKYMSDFTTHKWIMTYDNCQDIRKMYRGRGFKIVELPIRYSMQKVRKDKEILIVPKHTKVPH
jgi:Site-specific DNA methylase